MKIVISITMSAAKYELEKVHIFPTLEDMRKVFPEISPEILELTWGKLCSPDSKNDSCNFGKDGYQAVALRFERMGVGEVYMIYSYLNGKCVGGIYWKNTLISTCVDEIWTIIDKETFEHGSFKRSYVDLMTMQTYARSGYEHDSSKDTPGQSSYNASYDCAAGEFKRAMQKFKDNLGSSIKSAKKI